MKYRDVSSLIHLPVVGNTGQLIWQTAITKYGSGAVSFNTTPSLVNNRIPKLVHCLVTPLL